MLKKCRICGKQFDVLYPELWRYKEQWNGKQAKDWFCSWGCLREHEKRKEERKRERKMARPRKNTQPAEEQEPVIELVYDESIKEEYRKEQEEKRKAEEAAKAAEAPREEERKLEVAAVYSRVLGEHTYKKTKGGMALIGIDMTLVLEDYEWVRLAREIVQALMQLAGE